jgi:hypothetical protein
MRQSAWICPFGPINGADDFLLVLPTGGGGCCGGGGGGEEGVAQFKFMAIAVVVAEEAPSGEARVPWPMLVDMAAMPRGERWALRRRASDRFRLAGTSKSVNWINLN